jgi:hypothetical protein
MSDKKGKSWIESFRRRRRRNGLASDDPDNWRDECSKCQKVIICVKEKNTGWVVHRPETMIPLDDIRCKDFVLHEPGEPRDGEASQ